MPVTPPTRGIPRRAKPPQVTGDPLLSAKFRKYLSTLTFPTEDRPLSAIPAHSRPTLLEWGYMKRLRAKEQAEARENQAKKAVRRGASAIVVETSADADLDAFSFDDHARSTVALPQSSTAEDVILKNAARLKDMGFDMEHTGNELQQRANTYQQQLYKWMLTPAQLAQEKMLTSVYPAALSLKTGIADAGDVLALSLGDKSADSERWVNLIDKLTVNAITARLLLFVKEHFKLNPAESEVYLRYHFNQVFQQSTQPSEVERMMEMVLKLTKESDKLPPTLPYPGKVGTRRSRKPKDEEYT